MGKKRPVVRAVVVAVMAVVAMVSGTVVIGAGATASAAQLTPGSQMQLETVVDPNVSNPTSQYYSSDEQLLEQGNVQQAWSEEPTTSVQAPVIAVLDSGVNSTPELAGRLLPQVNFYPENGADGASCSGDPSTCVQDDMGHGTYVAQVAAGGATSTSNVTGVCPTCEVLPVRVGGYEPGTYLQDFSSGAVAGGIYYAASQPGVKAINLSLATYIDPAGTFDAAPPGQPVNDISSGSEGMLQYAVNYAISRGVTVVAGAGNYSSSYQVYPAADSGVLSVASVEPNGKLSYWSEHNGAGSNWVDVAAPGCYMVDFSGSPSAFCGTSSSTPYVAGLVGLMYEAFPGLGTAQATSLVDANATNPLDQENYWWSYTANEPSSSEQLFCAEGYCESSDAGVYTGSLPNPGYTLSLTGQDGYKVGFSYTSADPADPSGSLTATAMVLAPLGTQGLSVTTAMNTYTVGETWDAVQGGINYGAVNAASSVAAACALNPSGCPQPAPATTTTTAPSQTTTTTAPVATTTPSTTTTSPATAPTTTATTSPAPSGSGGGLPSLGGGFPALGGGGGGAPAPSSPATTAPSPSPSAPAPPVPSPAKAAPPTHSALPSSPPLAVAGSLEAGSVAALAPNEKGWWSVAKTGRVTAHGDARSYGSAHVTGSGPVALVPTSSGTGYWLVTSAGKVYAFGSAREHGSLKAGHPSIVGLAPAPAGKGYWLVTKTGQVFSFGDAKVGEKIDRKAPSATAKDPVVAVFVSKTGYTLLLSHGSQVGYSAKFVKAARADVERPCQVGQRGVCGAPFWRV